MRALQLARQGERLSILCLGAHSDDIEIGAGATLLSLMARGVHLDVLWCVLGAVGEREREARDSAAEFLSDASADRIGRALGTTGMTVILQLTSFLLVCIGVQIFWNGASALLLGLPAGH